MEVLKLLLEFISTIVTSAPLAFVIIFLIFRKPIEDSLSGLFGRLKEIKIGDNSASFSELLADISKEGFVANSADSQPEVNDAAVIEEIAIERPDIAVYNSWLKVDKLLNIANKLVPNPYVSYKPEQVIEVLLERGFLNHKQASFILSNYDLRNSFLHKQNANISYSDALVFKKNCDEIVAMLESIILLDR